MHPRIDPARVAVMGFSYPDCNVRLNGDTKSEPEPVRISSASA